MKIKDGKTNESEAEEANEYVGDKHGSIIKARFRFKLLAAYGTYLIHFQRMHDFQFVKHFSLATSRARHVENTAEAAHGAMINKKVGRGVKGRTGGKGLIISLLFYFGKYIGVLDQKA